jgi:5'-deoxynucleotidase YfbR-like HD superfamily hydrolase
MNEKSDHLDGWIQTFTGKRIYPLNPKVEDIDIYDIAHSLSNQSRFAGHSTHFYSVAQHCVLVSLSCSPDDALWGLLHDASESFLVDIPSPLKRLPEFQAYRDAESKLMGIICQVFGLPSEEPVNVKIVDKRMLVTEARDLTLSEGRGWAADVEPYDFHIKPWSPEHARAKYISRFHELFLKRR